MKVFVFIVLIALAFAAINGFFVYHGAIWYESLKQPLWKPPMMTNNLIGSVINILAFVSCLMIWTHSKAKKNKKRINLILGLFVIGAVLFSLSSYYFYYQKGVAASLYSLGSLILVEIAIIILSWKISQKGVALILPYGFWIILNICLQYEILFK